ncbi:MAG: SDR family oxidoreductase, partial [Actinobacteria bacterium]|nr:SDR family oxidoreductase [Actinomycetota bacterium]
VGDENLAHKWPEGVTSWNENVPMHRYATPDEVATFALLLTDSAYEFATGAIFDFDGGKSTSPGW